MPKMEHNEAYHHPHYHAGLVSEPLMVNSTAPEFATRANNHPSSNFISAFPACIPSNAGTTNSSYVNMHNGGCTSFPPNRVPHWLPPYNQSLSGDRCSTSYPHIDRVVAFKRKSPTIPLAAETNIVRYPQIGSHMNYPSYPASIEPNVPPPPENLSLNTTGMPACYMSDTNPPGEGSLRNVRSRHSEDFHPPAWFYASRNMSYSLYTSDDAVSGSRMTQQWSHFPAHMVPHGWIPTADAISFSHRSNQPTTRDNVGNGITATNSDYRSHLEQNRNQNAPMPILPSIITTGPVQSASAHNYSFIPYSNRDVGAPVGVETASSSRSLRLLPIVGHTSPGVSARGAHQRSHLMNHRLNTPNRWAPESAMVVDRLAFYDAANLHDQHRDMRLDIDGMSYEELLALGERIGNANTGLSEDSVSSCLVKTVHPSCEQIQDEGKCAICLEEYKENKKLGRLKCGHEYHICCISQWLKMKNVCPICRVSASSNASEK
ncbi:probable E3 ubiquitin-protein ligase RHG1A isoform X1 [Zingiber officinale]|uniref:probable E3 ubiquitin-protein ligase RHG1A isoform X1 n=2 Tax=Zingiber officinale TaxID=94328 RepID=UPI001C4D7075|nr:probable E3 ubiquitin-protein ligase RHG1A isoform X1 [Zingiber officinale]XP_042411058.1 probable E3 ubiquitin-protein ligase RHG1A isoform X1 [Zingiber officinale]